MLVILAQQEQQLQICHSCVANVGDCTAIVALDNSPVELP